MANNISTLSIGAVIDTSGIDRGLNRIQNSVSRFGGRVNQGGIPGAFGGGGGGFTSMLTLGDVLSAASPFLALMRGKQLTTQGINNMLRAAAEGSPRATFRSPNISPIKSNLPTVSQRVFGDPVAETARRILNSWEGDRDTGMHGRVPPPPDFSRRRRGGGGPPLPPDAPFPRGPLALGAGFLGLAGFNTIKNWNQYYKEGFQNAAGYYGPGSMLGAGVQSRVQRMGLYEKTPDKSMLARFGNAMSGGSPERSSFENIMDFLSTTYNTIHSMETLGAGVGVAQQLFMGDVEGVMRTHAAWKENINTQYKKWDLRSYGSSAEIKQWSKEQERLRKIEQRNAI